MRKALTVLALVLFVVVSATHVRAQTAAKPDADTLALGRKVYIVNDCYSCHAWYRVPHYRWGNLAKSGMVHADETGQTLNAFIRRRLGCEPNVPMSMQTFPEMPQREFDALAAYLRFEGKERMAGDRAAGEAVFGSAKCTSCHSATGDLAGVGPKYDTASLSDRLLPGATPRPDRFGPDTALGRTAHRMALEGRSAEELRNLLTYLLNVERQPLPIPSK